MMSFKDIEQRHLDHENSGGAARCPLCLSKQVEGGAVSVDPGRMEQTMNCNACCAQWVECYTMNQVILQNLGTRKEYGE